MIKIRAPSAAIGEIHGEAGSALPANPLKSNSLSTKTIYSLSVLDIRILGRNDILEKYVNKL